MDVTCPACHSTDTQKIAAPVVKGTARGKLAAGDLDDGASSDPSDLDATADSTKSSSHTEVTHTSPEPRLKTDGDPIVGTLVLSVVVGWIPALILYLRTGKLFSSAALFAASVFVIYVLIKRNIIKNRDYNENEYPKERDVWDNGFYCHDCGNVFVPASLSSRRDT